MGFLWINIWQCFMIEMTKVKFYKHWQLQQIFMLLKRGHKTKMLIKLKCAQFINVNLAFNFPFIELSLINDAIYRKNATSNAIERVCFWKLSHAFEPNWTKGKANKNFIHCLSFLRDESFFPFSVCTNNWACIMYTKHSWRAKETRTFFFVSTLSPKLEFYIM